MARRKKFTVGIWMTPKDRGGKPTGLQIWNIQKGEKEDSQLKWYTFVSADDEDEALRLGQEEYRNGTKTQEPKIQEPQEPQEPKTEEPKTEAA